MTIEIVFLDRDTIGPGVVIRKPAFVHDWREYHATAAEQIVPRLRNAQIAITNKVALDADTLAALPNLKFIAIAATGTDAVDLAACRERGIQVANVRGYAITTVPEHTLALILALRRNLVQYREQVIAGEWQRAGQFCFFNRPIHDLAGATLGLIGTGALASAVGALAEALAMQVLYHSVSGRTDIAGKTLVDLPTLLQTADVISCHCPLTQATYHLLDQAAFAMMKPTALLINTARGSIVDTRALLRAIDRQQIAGAALDVAASEPPPADSPVMELARRDNVIVTPHIAWASVEAMQALTDQVIDNIEAYQAGAPVNLV